MLVLTILNTDIFYPF